MVESVNMHIGEKRKIAIGVKSTCHKAFEITDASFELRAGDEVELSGECEVEMIRPDEMAVSAFIHPQRAAALYDLVYKYRIEPEDYIYLVHVRMV